MKRSIFCLLTFVVCLAIPQTAQAQTVLTLKEVMDTSLEASYDVQLAAIDVAISKTDIKDARSAYFPSLTARMNSEYSRNFYQKQNSSLTSVGGNVLLGNTIYQSTAGLSMNYTLLDFGQRRRKVEMARKEVLVKQMDGLQKQRDLLVKVIETYGVALLAFQEIETRKEILKLSRERFDLKQTLYQAGVASKIEVSDAALAAAENLSALETAKEQFVAALSQLTALTRVPYEEDTIVTGVEFADREIHLPDLERLPEYRAITLEIEKKKANLEMLRRERWAPTFSVYSNYFMYGTDPDNPFSGLKGLKSRNVTIGIGVAMPLFDGFKNAAQRAKTQLEIERLQIVRDQSVNNVVMEFEKTRSLVHSLQGEIQVIEDGMVENQSKQQLLDRLAVQQMVDRGEQIQNRIAYLTDKISFERARTRQSIAQQKLILYMERGVS